MKPTRRRLLRLLTWLGLARGVVVLAGRGHPAVQAAVLQVSWLDTYEFLLPGGLYRPRFVDAWTRVALGFDANDWPTAMGLSGWQRQALGWFVRGHKPVDGAEGKRLLREAVAGHRTQPANERSRDTICRDDKPRGAVTNWTAFSSYRARAGLEHAPVPLQVWASGLHAQLATHALVRFRGGCEFMRLLRLPSLRPDRDSQRASSAITPRAFGRR